MERKIACPKCGAENLAWRSNCHACGERLHGDERAIPAFQGRGLGFWVALGLAIVGTAAFGIVAYFTAGFTQGNRYLPYLALGPLPGLALCWKWPRAAAIELILIGLLPLRGVFSPPLANANDLSSALSFLTPPLLISGILFYHAGQRTRTDRAK
jgi:hypothetical protein